MKTGRNLTDIESVLVLIRDDKNYSIAQVAGFIEEAIKARPDPPQPDWDKLREEFFKECVDREMIYPSKTKISINLTPHNMFEWFKNKLTKQ